MPAMCCASRPQSGRGRRSAVAGREASVPRLRGRVRSAGVSCVLAMLVCALGATAAGAIPTPQQDPFYSYSGAVPLSHIAPGTVLKTRELSYHLVGIPLPITVVQLLYRSTDQLGQPAVNVTSVLEPAKVTGSTNVVAYESFYDSLNPDDEPSYQIAGGVTLGGLIPDFETALIVPELLAGDAVVVADIEGENADFADGPEYGMYTLDSLRAALRSPATGLSHTKKIGIIGYSGGAIGAQWAAEMAPTYAPDINRLLVGAAFGGVLVDPDHNLWYVNGSSAWAGIIPMAVIGVARSFHVDLTQYLSAAGVKLYNQLQTASILNVLLQYPGLTFQQLLLPQDTPPETIPIYVSIVNQLIMGSDGTPTVPLFIGQGDGDNEDGTIGNQPGIGGGDGVMVAGDVRTLASEYCQRGVPVQYNEYDGWDHVVSALFWLAQALPWLNDRFAGQTPPQDCSTIPPGNSLAPVTLGVTPIAP